MYIHDITVFSFKAMHFNEQWITTCYKYQQITQDVDEFLKCQTYEHISASNKISASRIYCILGWDNQVYLKTNFHLKDKINLDRFKKVTLIRESLCCNVYCVQAVGKHF